MCLNIEGAVALVTGAGSGIGRATALRLSRDGATVAVNDIDEARARDSVRLIEQEGGRAMPMSADVANDGDVRKMISDVRSCFGRLDIVVNNAGVVEAGPTPRVAFPELEPERWLRVLDINVRGVFLGTQHAIAAMRGSGGGVIINISSMAGIGIGPHPAPVYAASKAAVVRFTRELHLPGLGRHTDGSAYARRGVARRVASDGTIGHDPTGRNRRGGRLSRQR